MNLKTQPHVSTNIHSHFQGVSIL